MREAVRCLSIAVELVSLGEVVNVASRLEQVNKPFGTAIAFREEIRTAVAHDVQDKAEFMCEIQLKGCAVSTTVDFI